MTTCGVASGVGLLDPRSPAAAMSSSMPSGAACTHQCFCSVSSICEAQMMHCQYVSRLKRSSLHPSAACSNQMLQMLLTEALMLTAHESCVMCHGVICRVEAMMAVHAILFSGRCHPRVGLRVRHGPRPDTAVVLQLNRQLGTLETCGPAPNTSHAVHEHRHL